MAAKILLVEDEPYNRQMVSGWLRNREYEVTEAKDGSEALDELGKRRFDLVISDLVLPQIHGFDLVDEIHSRWPNTLVLMVSGYLSPDSAAKILDGMAEFLQKPFERQSLLAKVERLLPGNTVAH